jgi:putative ABC transport system permease protein
MLLVLWQHWLQRPTRFFFTLISLVLSTATLVGILVASHNARNSFRELSNAVQGLASLDVTHSEGGRFELSRLDVAVFEKEVQGAIPTLIRGTKLRFQEQAARGMALGIPVSDSSPSYRNFLLRNLELDEGQWLGEDECWISSLIASQLKVEEGDTVQCLFRRGFKKLLIKKVIAGRIWNRTTSEHGIIVDLKWLQDATALPMQIDRYRLFLKNDSELEKNRVLESLSAHVPSPLVIKERTNTVGLADDLLKSTELGLSFASALAVAMAAYILLNTSRMNLAERRPYFAILRCLGATTTQIVRAVLLEALSISLFGVVFGLAAGLGLGMMMRSVLSRVLQAPPGAFTIPWFSLVAIAIFIPILTLFVVWFAQKQQEAVSPLESFREPAVVENTRLPWRSIRNGFLMWLASLVGLNFVRIEWLPPQWGVGIGLMSLLAYLLWLPTGLAPLIWIVDRFAGLRSGFPLEVAKNQLVRRPERTSLNAGFLVISLCGAVGLGQSLMSNTAEIKRWYHRTLPGDLFLIGTQDPSLLIDSEDPLREMVEQLPGRRWSNAIRFVWCQVEQKTVMCVVREFPDAAPFPTEPKGMSTDEARKLIDGDQVIIGSILAKKLRKKAGDALTVTVDGRAFSTTVGGVNANFANGGMALIIKRSTAQKYFELTGFNWYAISVSPEQIDQAEKTLDSVREQYGFEIRRGTEMRQGVEQAISGVTAGIWCVVFISFITGGFGIATTLAMNMLEQARDFSLLRIVGASRGQLMLTVLTQAWLLGVLGVVFGVFGGITTVLVIYACSEALLGYTPEFEWNFLLMIASALGTLVIVTIAAWVPAWNASKINPVEHLTYE